MRRALAFLSVLALAASWLITTAADWPTYLADGQRSGASAGETTLSVSNASSLTKAWTFKTGGVIAASPTVVGGVVYVGSWDGYEYALDAATGSLKWKTFLGITTGQSGCSPQTLGISSAAAVAGGVVYVGGGDSYWYALDAATGNVLWRIFTGDNSAASGHYNWSSPLLYNGYAYIGVASLGDCPLVQGQLIQVSLSTHQVVNTFNVVPNGQVGGGIWTSPAVDPVTNTIFMTTGTIANPNEVLAQAIVAVDATSMTLKDSWQLPANQAVQDSDWGTSPTLFSDTAGDLLLAATNKNGFAYVFKRSNLAAGPLWQQQIAVGGICPTCGDGSVSSGAFANNTLFLAGGNTTIGGTGYPGSVRAFDPATGAVRWQHGAPKAVVPALAYANGLVIDGAGANLEVLNAQDGTVLFTYKTGAALYAAPSVSNGMIFTGGVDTNVYAFGLGPGAPPPPDPNCPSGWVCQDIGTPTPAGSESVNGNTWTIQAGGAGIRGTTDAFRLLSETVSGDTQVTAQVSAIGATAPGSQAGLMVRQSNDPTAPSYAVIETASSGLSVQWRTAFGGATTIANTIASSAAPIWLEIQRIGNQFQAATSPDGTTYTLVPGTSATVPMPAAVLAGLAVSSDLNGTAVSATIGSPAVSLPGVAPSPAPSASPCPAAWSCADVGNPLLVGDQSLSGTTWTLSGAGTDIAGYTDQFHYVWQGITGDGTISARVATQTNPSAGAKTGVMLRQSTNAGAAYYGVFSTPTNGVLVQDRTSQGLQTNAVASTTGAAPIYLEVARSGNTFTAYTSSDGITFTAVAGSSVVLSLGTTLLSGMAVTSAAASTMGSATLDTVSLTTTAPPPPVPCVTNWSCADIGSPAVAGNQALSNGTWTVQGGGGDIWNAADQFHYVWQSLTGGGSVIAHVTAQTNTSVWAKAGVMLRASTDPGSPNYSVFLTPANGITVQKRVAQGGTTAKIANPAGTVPAWIQVSFNGTSFSAYTSGDGVTWSLIAGSTTTIAMGSTLLAGMAVTAHNNCCSSTATMDNVAVSTTVPPPPPPPACPATYTCADIGTPAPAGTQSTSGGTWTIQGGGGDIWGTADQFHFVSQSLAGTGSVSVHVTSQTNTNAWAKAGVMLRQSSDPGAAYYAVFTTPSNGITVQVRTAQGGTTAKIANPAGGVPVWLLVANNAGTFTGYTSPDGTTWNPIAGSQMALTLTSPLLAGVAVTSHNNGTLSTVVVDTVTVSNTVPPPPPPPPPPSCPTGWTCADIGNPALAGSQSLNATTNTWSIQGGGTDIYNAADQFHYVWKSLAADGTVSAHVLTQTNTSGWAKAGVMLRLTQDPGSPYYAVFVTPGNGITVQVRTVQGGGTNKIATATGTVAIFLKITRTGTTFSAAWSSDGATWTTITNSTVTAGALTGSLLEGMAVTSHNGGALCTVTLDTVVTS